MLKFSYRKKKKNKTKKKLYNVSPPVQSTSPVHQSSPLVQSSDCRWHCSIVTFQTASRSHYASSWVHFSPCFRLTVPSQKLTWYMQAMYIGNKQKDIVQMPLVSTANRVAKIACKITDGKANSFCPVHSLKRIRVQ